MAFENGTNLNFTPQRTYIIYDNRDNIRRGYHAHINLKQLAVCVAGSCKFMVYDGISRDVFELNSPSRGLYLEGLVWREMYDFSPDCVLMVLASDNYDTTDYVRDYQKFLTMVGK